MMDSSNNSKNMADQNWRELSRPRSRRLASRFGLGAVTTTTAPKKNPTPSEDTTTPSLLHSLLDTTPNDLDKTGPNSLASSEKKDLPAHFAALNKAAVAVCIQEQMARTEMELDALQAEAEQLANEIALEDEILEQAEVEGQWEDGVQAIGGLFG